MDLLDEGIKEVYMKTRMRVDGNEENQDYINVLSTTLVENTYVIQINVTLPIFDVVPKTWFSSLLSIIRN